jgi:hypothetical protein
LAVTSVLVAPGETSGILAACAMGAASSVRPEVMFAEDDDDFVAGDELFHDGGGFAGLGLVVLGDAARVCGRATPPAALTSSMARHGALVAPFWPKTASLPVMRGELADPDGLRRGAATGQAKGEACGQDAGAEDEPTQGEQGADGHEGVESG